MWTTSTRDSRPATLDQQWEEYTAFIRQEAEELNYTGKGGKGKRKGSKGSTRKAGRPAGPAGWLGAGGGKGSSGKDGGKGYGGKEPRECHWCIKPSHLNHHASSSSPCRAILFDI